MNNNIFIILYEKSIEELEKMLNIKNFTENEIKFFNKSKELIDQGFEMTSRDNGQKVIEAALIYYVLKCKKKNNNIDN